MLIPKRTFAIASNKDSVIISGGSFKNGVSNSCEKY